MERIRKTVEDWRRHSSSVRRRKRNLRWKTMMEGDKKFPWRLRQKVT